MGHFTPFCVGCEAAQMATLPSLIYAHFAGDRSLQMRKGVILHVGSNHHFYSGTDIKTNRFQLYLS
jgi:hypothetical protein